MTWADGKQHSGVSTEISQRYTTLLSDASAGNSGRMQCVGQRMKNVAAMLIETVKPLLTVNITWQWIVTALVASFVGALVSAIYPAWRAIRVDIVTALTLE